MLDTNLGRSIGHYRLIRPLGAGGMGEVYLAQRESDFNKNVAIKLIRPEMVTSDIVRRFTIERQTLAALNHPHIVHLLDGGTTEEGLPYLVVDYVEGIPIHEYCAKRRLSVEERLRLFVEVCAAVHHAHQSLVVHCDLKPGNILVTAEGAPMLLDFGIAKLLNPRAVGVTQQMSGETRAGFTPQYASPEQMLGLQVTTSTDIYALGVILYELLTGRTPHDMAGSMADWIRSICEKDADAPSTAVRRRTAEPAQLPRDPQTVERALRGDLDAIVLKSLRKEPRDRYGSVDQMAEDIRRHMDGRPVLAHKNTTQYVVRKFLVRHKWGVAAAFAALVLMLAGVGSTVYQARIARQRFEDIRSLAHTFLFDVHDAIQDLPGSTPARALIAKTGTDYLDRLSKNALGDRALQAELAEGYMKIGDVEGNPFVSNLGDSTKATENFRKALAIAEAIGIKSPADSARLGHIHENLAGVIAFSAKSTEALEHAHKAIELYQQVLGADPGNLDAKLDLSRGYETLGDLQGGARGINAGLTREAQVSYEKSLSLLPTDLPFNHPRAARVSRGRAVMIMKIGDMVARILQLTDAMQRYQTALQLAQKLVADDPNNFKQRNLVSVLLNKIGGTYMILNQNDAAEKYYQQALGIDEQSLTSDPTNERARSAVIVSVKNLGDLYYYNLSRFAEALKLFHRVADLLEEQIKADPTNIVWRENLSSTLSYIASALVELKRVDEARPWAVKSLATSKALADRPDATHDQVYNYAWLGITMDPEDLQDGKAVLPYALRAVQMSKGTDPFDLHVLALAYANMKDFQHAEEYEAKAAALFPPHPANEKITGAQKTVEDRLVEFRKKLGKPEPQEVAKVTAVLAAKSKPAFALEDWMGIPGWTREASMLKHQGGDFVLATPDFDRATVEFAALPTRGKRVAWVAAYRDLRNYFLFELDEKNLTRTRIVEGKRGPSQSFPHQLQKGTAAKVRIQVNGDNIVHSVFREGQWRVLDQWNAAQGALRGKFGFYIPGKDEIALSEFTLTL